MVPGNRVNASSSYARERKSARCPRQGLSPSPQAVAVWKGLGGSAVPCQPPASTSQCFAGLRPAAVYGGWDWIFLASYLSHIERRLLLAVLGFTALWAFPSPENSSSREDAKGVPMCGDTHEQNCLRNRSLN